jgi:hypothetical protein
MRQRPVRIECAGGAFPMIRMLQAFPALSPPCRYGLSEPAGNAIDWALDILAVDAGVSVSDLLLAIALVNGLATHPGERWVAAPPRTS